MAEVRINGRRFPILQAVAEVGSLTNRIESIANRENMALTRLLVNGEELDLDGENFLRLRLDPQDLVEARLETAEQLALQSLQIAQEMAELLVFDIKVATLNLWDNTRFQQRSLETLLRDCELFLTLGARPVELLGQDPSNVERAVELSLRQLDTITHHVQDAILLAVHGKTRDAGHVLVGRVMPAIERWLGLSAGFAEFLELERRASAQNQALAFEGNTEASVVPVSSPVNPALAFSPS